MTPRTLPASSRALRFTAFGPPTQLRVVDVVRPAPRFGEVLVQIQAAGLNPSDLKNVEGRFPQTTLPRTPGRDFAGTIVDGPDHLEGLEVWGTGGDLGFTREGTHAEFVRVPLEGVRPRPPSLTPEQAAVAGVPFVTAWLALVQAARIQAGETVLVIGGTGAVGTAAAQLARWMGARVLSTTRRDQVSELWQNSVDHAIHLGRDPLPAAALAITGGKGVDVVLNTVGGETFAPGLACATKGGRVVAIASKPPSVSFDLVAFYRRQLTLHGVDSLAHDASACGPILERLAEGFARGALRIAPPRPVPLAEAVGAYQQLAQGSSEKFALVPGAR